MEMGDSEEKTFQNVKQELLKGRLLRTFDLKKALIIKTDTSDHTTAEMASQDGQLLEFISKKMNQAEQNYTISKKKMMAIIQAVKEWRKYLEENTMDNRVITDHKNLTYFRKIRITNRRQVRWTLKVQDILFKLKY